VPAPLLICDGRTIARICGACTGGAVGGAEWPTDYDDEMDADKDDKDAAAVRSLPAAAAAGGDCRLARLSGRRPAACALHHQAQPATDQLYDELQDDDDDDDYRRQNVRRNLQDL